MCVCERERRNGQQGGDWRMGVNFFVSDGGGERSSGLAKEIVSKSEIKRTGKRMRDGRSGRRKS